MSSINHILLPTDGSEGSMNAAKVAGELSRALQAKVTVLYVLSDEFLLEHSWGAAEFIGGRPEGLRSVEEIRDSLEKSAREKEILATTQALGETDSEPEIALEWGHAAERITKFANDNQVSLIVIGSHGRSALKRAFLGSGSQAVANQAKCPVTIVK
jgi:nucleotide-binding universal stress UspA family protein